MINYFRAIMRAIRAERESQEPLAQTRRDKEAEAFADEQLVIATRCAMMKRLKEGREQGRFGWWDNNVCTLNDLYQLRHKALKDKDHISVLNFTAMIAARESE
ncbi:hypothetical protein [Vibrio phage D4]|nr:hypothetical protein vBVcaS_HC092 [Vibrio phage vB_VcaS_HC]UHD87267.1 hypothetical protein [Vibrio phage D4]